jgi:hypothetical protein
VDVPEKTNVSGQVKMDVNVETKMDANGEVRDDVKDGKVDLDDLFRSPNAAFGSFSVLHDPSTSEPDSISLLRVGIGARKLGSGSLFLYGLIKRECGGAGCIRGP